MYNNESSSSMQLNPWQQWAFRIEKKIQEQEDTITALQATIEQLQKKLDGLEQQCEQQTQVQSEINCQPPVFHVEKIEYHFDQLKVETLEGSLQIGMTAASSSQLPTMIEDIALKQQAAQSKPPPSYSENTKYKQNTSKHKQNNSSYSPNSKAPIQTIKTSNIVSYNEPTANDVTGEALALPAGYEQYVYEQLSERLKLHGSAFIRSQATMNRTSLNEEHLTLMLEDLEKQLAARIEHYIEAYGHDIFQSNARNEQATWEQLQNLVQEKTWQDIEAAIIAYLKQQAQQ